MSVYNFKDVEAKWQHKWEETNQYKTDTRDTSKPLYYTLEMFPYPSGKRTWHTPKMLVSMESSE